MVMVSISGCADWRSDPKRVMGDYGNSVREMVSLTLYSPQKAQNPNTLAPDGMEGQKAAVLLQRTYQSDIGSASRVRAVPQMNISQSAGTPGMAP